MALLKLHNYPVGCVGVWGVLKWECTMSKIHLHLMKWKCHYVSPAATARCGPFVNDSWIKLQLREHMSFFFFICKRNFKKEGGGAILQSLEQSSKETRLKVMCQSGILTSISAVFLFVTHHLEMKSPWTHISHAFAWVFVHSDVFTSLAKPSWS